jgi:hypothetical protein
MSYDFVRVAVRGDDEWLKEHKRRAKQRGMKLSDYFRAAIDNPSFVATSERRNAQTVERQSAERSA